MFTLLITLSARLQEKHTREQLCDHLRGVVAIHSELKDVQTRLKEVQKLIKQAHLRQQRMLAASTKYVTAVVAHAHLQFASSCEVLKW